MRLRSLASVWLVSATLAVVYACSTFEEARVEPTAPDATAEDAAVPDDGSTIVDAGTTDSADAAVRCSHDAPFVTIRSVDGVNSPNREAEPHLTPDELVIYFSYRAPPGAQGVVYRAERAKRTDAFGPPAPVAGLPSNAGRASPRADELEVTFVLLSAPRSIKRARRGSRLEAFSNVETHPLGLPVAEGRDWPSLSKDGREALYGAYSVSTGYDIGRAVLDGDGGVVDAGLVAVLNADSHESDIVLATDGLAAYWYSDRGVAPGFGSTWVSRRDTPSSAFRTPRRIDELLPDGGTFTAPGFASEDGCRLYFYADSSPGTDWDLFVAERMPQ